ncbi:unnamed protein product [Durusdinium trenchii]|uniref:Uncharacterized protein n=1 Tax=Durusdinium trenchii TaxID=1381693 RepID=A0ABP0PJW3_9DINO
MAVMHMARHAMPHGVDVRPASPMYLTPRSHSPHAHLRNLMVPPGQMMTQTQPAALQLGQVGSMPAPAIAAAVANLISNANASLRDEGRGGCAGTSPQEAEKDRSMEETMKPLSQIYNDRTTGLMGCPLTVPKYSQRLKHSESPPPERRRVSPRPAPQKDFDRAWERCHQDLYEDAFARQQRLRDMQSYVKQMEEDNHKDRMMKCQEGIKQRRRYYRGRAVENSHLEREEENLRRRQEHQARSLQEQRMRELDELRGCTFRPCLVKKLNSSPTTPRLGERPPGSSPRRLRLGATTDDVGSVSGYSVEYTTTRLQNLVEAQQDAYAKLQTLAEEEGPLKERLRGIHGELHERIQREETQRVVSMLQDADSGSSSQKDLVQRVRDMVAQGQDPEKAQQQIVEELVLQSQDEVRRRVMEHFGPLRLEAEGELYSRQLSVAHELESLEAKAIALHGGTLCEEAKLMGFDFNLAAQVRQNLRQVGLPRMSSAMSRVDSSVSSQVEVARAPSTGRMPKVDSPGSPWRGARNPAADSTTAPEAESLESPRAAPLAAQHAQATAQALQGALRKADSSPVRRLQLGQRVILPNGMVAVAMPSQVAQAEAVQAGGVGSPRRLMHMMTAPLPSKVESPRMEADGSPRRLQMSKSQEFSPRRSQTLSSLQEADASPRRRVQMSTPEVEIIPDGSAPGAQAESISPRQSMASLASLGSYQAPPSGATSPLQQSRESQILVNKVLSAASSRADMQVAVQAVQSTASLAEKEPPDHPAAPAAQLPNGWIRRDPEADAPGASLGGIARQFLAQSQPQLPPAQPAQVGSMTLPARPVPMMRPAQAMQSMPQMPMQAMTMGQLNSPRLAPQMQIRPPLRPMVPMVRPM